ncbi:MAG: hypothetical protein Q6366_005500 [Candidatus Freyarchaeota archaeon]
MDLPFFPLYLSLIISARRPLPQKVGTVLQEATDDQIYDWMDENVPSFEHLLTDNGVQMNRVNRRAGQYCRKHGTKHIWASAHPQTLGKISRAQKELKAILRVAGYSSRQDLEQKTSLSRV